MLRHKNFSRLLWPVPQYGKNKVWGGPVTWKKSAKSWKSYRKWHLQRTLSMVLTAFLTAIQCEVVQNHHFKMIVKVIINPKWPWTHSTLQVLAPMAHEKHWANRAAILHWHAPRCTWTDLAPWSWHHQSLDLPMSQPIHRLKWRQKHQLRNPVLEQMWH